MWMLAAGASALSLGGSRGQVTIGAPVDLAFEIQPDAGTDVAGSCVTAQVVAGETPLGDARVRVTPIPESRGRPPAVRVQTTVVVDEPVLSVTLSAGCSGRTVRTYTFLSELPSLAPRTGAPVDVARLAQAVVQGVGPGPVRPSPGPVAAETGAPAASAPGRRAPAKPNASDSARPPVAALAPGRPVKPKAAPSVVKAPASRLVVEPLDTWLDSPVVLRSAPLLSITPDEQPSAQRAQAAALWKTLNIQPGDIDPDAERAKVLEGDLATAKAQAERERVSAAQLQEQLAQVENERFSPTVVYALAGLLALALVFAAWAVVRLRKASERAVKSWRDSVALGSRESIEAHDAAAGPAAPRPYDTWPSSETQPATGPASERGDLGVTIPPALGPASAPVPLQPPTADPAPKAPLPAPAPALHIVNPEELFDIQQQAEFFVSVGEHQQAIEVLKHHIAEHRKTSPLAYLELLRLYHTLSRVDEFAQLRTQFMQWFNAQVPDFAAFSRAGRVLEHYTDALAEIEAQWTSPTVLELLESYLFREEGGATVAPFDLAAYDDLLLLLSVAQTTPASARGAPPPRQRTTPMAPLRSESAVFSGALPSSAGAGGAGAGVDSPRDLLASGIDFDFDSLPGGLDLESPEAKPFPVDSLAVPLDLDLSDEPHLTLSDLPAVPVTPPPPRGQPVGFGMDNDLMELRLELDQRKKSDLG
ncbi:hypothetical protein BSY15_3024 [Acidovorax sp. RAC01]|nr:hypothetical protein BSY15_3024 [Acidovorax sp. RAC01]